MSEERSIFHVGQMNAPSQAEFREAFEGIFTRRFYTNHGPLEQALDDAIAAHLGVRHAISLVNGTTALMLLLNALELRGEVILPAFTFQATAQAVVWAGLTPVFCDVDPDTHMIDASLVEPLIGSDTAAILGVHVWGRACDPASLADLANRHGIRLLFDAAHGFGCAFQGRHIGGFGNAEVFSFHATKILNGLEGGCITTNDDALAARLRIARSFHGDNAPAGLRRMNAKISEAQAAMALLGLRHLHRLIEENRDRYEAYRRGLADIQGLRFVDYAEGEKSNYQYIVATLDCEAFGVSRDALFDALQERRIFARRYFFPGIHRTPPFSATPWRLPASDALCQILIQFPNGQQMTEGDVANICAAVRAAPGEAVRR